MSKSLEEIMKENEQKKKAAAEKKKKEAQKIADKLKSGTYWGFRS